MRTHLAAGLFNYQSQGLASRSEHLVFRVLDAGLLALGGG
jgi:hypothetical protein